MGRDWRHDFVDGETRMACSICGSSRRFPSEITYCVDKLFRCNDKCMERTTFEIDQDIAASRRRRVEPDTSIGNPASWEATQTFSAIAVERRAQLIPGWTPTTTFHDTFDVLVGGGGSNWTTSITAPGAVSMPSTGIAKMDSVSTAGVAQAWTTAVTVPRPNLGKFYMLAKFAVGTVVATSDLRVGVVEIIASVPQGRCEFVGARGSNSKGFYVAPAAVVAGAVVSLTEIDAAYHYAELWFNGNGYSYGAVDFGNVGVVPPLPTVGGTSRPYICAAFGSSLLIDEMTVFV